MRFLHVTFDFILFISYSCNQSVNDLHHKAVAKDTFLNYAGKAGRREDGIPIAIGI